MSSQNVHGPDLFVKSYITDKDGNISDIIISYNDYIKIEEALLDYGLGKSMQEIVDEEELSLGDLRKNIDK